MTTKIFSIVLIIGLLLAAPNTTFAATPADKVECGFWETLLGGCKEIPNNKPHPQPSPKPTPKLPTQGVQVKADEEMAKQFGVDVGSLVTVLASTIVFFPANGGTIRNPCDAATAFWGHMLERRPMLLPLIEAGITTAAINSFDHSWLSPDGATGVSKFVVEGKIFLMLWGAPRLLTSFDVTGGNLKNFTTGMNKIKDAARLKSIADSAKIILGCKPQTEAQWASALAQAKKEYRESASKIEIYEAPPISLVPAPLRVATPPATTHTLNSTGKYVVPIEFRGLTDQEICYLLAAGIIIFVGVTIVSTGGTSAPALVFALAVIP